MKTETYPLPMPEPLAKELRAAAKRTGLSMADIMRQSIKLGLPKLIADLSAEPLKPFTKEECRQAWQEPDPEFDAFAAHCASLRAPAEPANE